MSSDGPVPRRAGFGGAKETDGVVLLAPMALTFYNECGVAPGQAEAGLDAVCSALFGENPAAHRTLPRRSGPSDIST